MPSAKSPGDPVVTEKIQKYLADAGVGSRREIERWIVAGRITVNGEQAHVGQRVHDKDQIYVDNRKVGARKRNVSPEIILLNKNAGTVCTRSDPENRPTVFAELPTLRNSRWVSVGRLDIQTTGLLALTNDGVLANKLMHPSTGLDREYAVRVGHKLEEEQLKLLTEGIVLEGETLRFSDVRFYDGGNRNFWYHVVLMEGKNREVRRLFEAVGTTVSRLKRVRYGPIALPSWLRVGQWTYLQQKDVEGLCRLLGLRYKRPEKTKERRQRVAKTSCLLPYPELKPK